MILNFSSVVFLLVSLVVITSSSKLGLPSNYTWPLNAKRICFAARFKLTVNVQYVQADDSKKTVNIPLDNSTFESYSVACNEPENIHQLTISMLNPFTVFIFKFSVNASDFTSLTSVYGYLYLDEKQKYVDSSKAYGTYKFSSDQDLFQSPRGNSFRCNTQTQVQNITTNGTAVNITSINLENLLIQPFYNSSKDFDQYDNEVVCAADVTKDSNLIPIIVGACLAVLIVVVLVAYLIGRRRSRAGYQTV